MPRLRREFARRAPDEVGLLGDDKLEDEEGGGPVPWEAVKLLDKVRVVVSWPIVGLMVCEKHRSIYFTRFVNGTF